MAGTCSSRRSAPTSAVPISCSERSGRCSHVTSETARVLPVAAWVERGRSAGFVTIVDGAHGPGQLDLDLNRLGADAYVGNCHKWLCAPKGSAFLHVRRELQPNVHPLVIGWGYKDDATFLSRHEGQGTRDPSAFLTVPDAIFKGLARGHVHGRGQLLYAADFHHNQIVVVNGRFHRVQLAGGFHDPNLPHGFAPFNIQNIDGRLYVAYAMQDSAAEDEIAGAGLGFVDVYSRRGFLMHRVVSRGALDAPWGLVQAPAGFGRFGHALLVGNFGDGRINAYNIRTGHWLGQLHRPNGHAVEIDGLWGLRFGNGVTGDRKSLLFSAGIDDEAHGLFGLIRAAG